jgi:hypothetical protein
MVSRLSYFSYLIWLFSIIGFVVFFFFTFLFISSPLLFHFIFVFFLIENVIFFSFEHFQIGTISKFKKLLEHFQNSIFFSDFNIFQI